jgi:DNA-binding HxlR family transcriptional regulator
MTEELMAYLGEHPDYFYIIRDKQLIAIIRFLSSGGKSLEEIEKEFGLQQKRLQLILDELIAKNVITTMKTDAGEMYILEFDGQKILDLLEKAKTS